MTRDSIKDVIIEIIEDIDEDADFDNLDPDQPLRDQLELRQLPRAASERRLIRARQLSCHWCGALWACRRHQISKIQRRCPPH